ncbi:ESX secretion-associated protein EspG [Mycobacterium sp. DL592]|uniref:ESX secretion-associated protein EspG n=1 Tax=Mycobacterium sp. DL592 TaxID=2675524 RepID=UPI001FB88EC4|nr:ESX secretion-associated protein EspG [Mycobacterium sp. DL592]
MSSPNAAELSVEAAWFIAEAVGAGTFPWVLGVTTPPHPVRPDDVPLEPAVADWIRVVCHPEQWYEMRCVSTRNGSGDLLRGIIARRGEHVVVALRNAQLITFTEMAIHDAAALVPVLTVGLENRPPASFPDFRIPARVGARADAQLRAGAELSTVMDYLGIPRAAREMVSAVFAGPRSYVEIVSGQNRDGSTTTSPVGVAVVDCEYGRVLVTPDKADDGEWISTFTPGSPAAIARAVDTLAATLPEGRWFSGAGLFRELVH